ncbi:MAG TPA: hypothetical protein PLD20_21230 [Blastocatellia bacterium]|nr:hypothetical protein [Blastocatellia bacterium]HMV82410.1 hypothetical protein [Blastocatellia bacterium]HMY76064.1 hypothetical protein [Blastocatellia bacterium]HMZ20474.1 hypothetical protein [Blastocatellia bacterium]HNG33608.1 hypothetical protein [Blastocatellia bacterium]
MNRLPTKNLLACVVVLLGWIQLQAAQEQRPNRPGAPPRTEGPNRPGIPNAIKPAKTRPQLPLKKGDLFLYRTPGAEVTLVKAPRRDGKPSAEVIQPRETQQNFVLFSNLTPGVYEVRITHEDYETVHGSVVIGNKPLPWDGVLSRFRFRDVTLLFNQQLAGSGGSPASELRVALDGELLSSDKLRYGKDEIVLRRVPVGRHGIQVAKSGYEEWNRSEFDVAAETTKASLLAVDLKPATIALTVRAKPGAGVYLVNDAGIPENKGSVPIEGELLITGLSPGAYKLRASLEGYEDAERAVALTLDERRPRVSMELEPLVETLGGTASFDAAISNWFPRRPPEWKVDDGRGMLVRGEQPALFAGPRKTGHAFGYYGDFTLVLMLKLDKNTSASWIACARDEKNYYRFDLTPDNTIAFFLCRDGQRGASCQKIQTYDVTIERDRPDDVLTIELRVEGSRFKHRFTQSRYPEKGLTELGVGTFADETFKVGGVGLYALDGAEFYLYQFSVILKNSGQSRDR